MRAPVDQITSTVKLVLPLLRADAAVAIESEAVPREGGPDLASIGEDGAAWIGPLLHAIREAERLVGRPRDDAPAWLDAVIDGGAL